MPNYRYSQIVELENFCIKFKQVTNIKLVNVSRHGGI